MNCFIGSGMASAMGEIIALQAGITTALNGGMMIFYFH